MRFQVYKEGKLADTFSLDGAYVFDSEGAALRVSESLDFADSVISFDMLTYEAGGLAVMWEVEGLGKMQLCTTKLRKRSEPYILNLELARARLMQITLKREDWQLFDENDNHTNKAIVSAEKLFVSALSHINEPEKASLYADKCLKKAVLASENLAQRHAETNLNTKAGSGKFNEMSFGCTLQPKFASSESYRRKILDLFNYAVIPVSWGEIEKKKGEYDFSPIDNCLAAFGSQKIRLSAGPLLKFERGVYPEWLGGYEYDGIKELAYNFITKIIKRYAGKIDTWQLVGSMNSSNDLGFSFDECIEICRAACLAARAANSKTVKIISLDKPWGWYHSRNACTIPTVQFAETLVQNAITFDKIGIELDLSGKTPDAATKDLMQISAMIDSLTVSSRPICVTSIKVPSKPIEGSGYWREPWSENTQAAFLRALYKILLAKDQMASVTYDSFVDIEEPVGIVSSEGEPKKAMKTLRNFRKLLSG
ncbi:Beta-xylosidase [Sedimentisphaera cyanobacteriorum]|uniref:Beta-xylosidase n=1 Tax=Sedimentisphaera cyanobacteriorum TaxID=1940790 RepID=A0A1Q2HNJ1_9BACT|nr:endo-1,4-beta-xylanase [Sedimentisphaera cyanobacteriorum]AQQ08891.1 Beta-xylosidase [Sedimentisphaera cyanobacteriorum]